MPRSSGYGRGHTRRRITEWGTGPGDSVVTTQSASGNIFLGLGVIFTTQATLIRLRGLLSLTLNTINAANAGFHGAVGVGICTAEAFAQGQAAVPDAVTDVDWDGWFWHHFFDIHSATSAIADGVNAATCSQRIEVDSKAMRKWNESDVVYAKLQGVLVGAASMSIFFDSRMLIKLP